MRITLDTVGPEVRRIVRQVNRPRVLLEAMSKAVEVDVRKFLRELESKGNARGWPSQHFFAGGKDSVDKHVGLASINDRQAVVAISDPRFYHHVAGGEVTWPKRAQAGIIPLIPEAAALAGKGSVRESAPWLVPIKTAKGTFLASVSGGVAKFWFKLVKSVTHRPHPDSMPPRRRLSDVAKRALIKAGNLLLRAR